jgi:putative aldouronate transport system permease protein
MRVRKTFLETSFSIINHIILLTIAFLCLFPFIYIFMVSLIDQKDYYQYGITLIPKHVSLNNYQIFLGPGSKVVRAYGVTITVTVVGTLISLLITSLFAYALSRKYLPGKKYMSLFIVFTFLFSAGLIPRYLLVKNLGMFNTLWAIMIPQALSGVLVFMMITFFKGIPYELEESAKMDGANDWLILFRIYFPLALPAYATVGLFYAISRWNEWFDALMFITKNKLFPLQLTLRDIIMYAQPLINPLTGSDVITRITPPQEIIKMTAIIVAVLPILFTYPFVQKYFVKGAVIGSLKA